jgi:hypothetical protein
MLTNRLAAFEHCLNLGSQCLELDVYLTRDGQVNSEWKANSQQRTGAAAIGLSSHSFLIATWQRCVVITAIHFEWMNTSIGCCIS